MADISVTYTSVPSDYQDVFSSCTNTCLNDYKYLIVESNNTLWQSTSSYASFDIRFDDSFVRRFIISYQSPYSVYELPFINGQYNVLQFRTSGLWHDWFSGDGVTFTLTDTLDSGAPSGSITFTDNGTYDVTQYAEAVVDVPPTVIEGTYHDDLNSIHNSIIVCGAVMLVLYFFYCIYRLIIKSTGGRQ